MTTARSLAAVLALLACHTPPNESTRLAEPAVPPRRAVAFPEGWRFKAGERAAFGQHSMIASIGTAPPST